MTAHAPKKSLLLEIKENTRPCGPGLLVDKILVRLPATDREELLEALRSPTEFGARPIAKALTARGFRCGPGAVTLWRERNLK